MCNTYCLPATTVGMRTHLNVTFIRTWRVMFKSSLRVSSYAVPVCVDVISVVVIKGQDVSLSLPDNKPISSDFTLEMFCVLKMARWSLANFPSTSLLYKFVRNLQVLAL